MGKNLKGKEIGKGICQRKDGLYVARFVNRYGNRTTKCFPTIPEAKNWLSEAKYADSHEEVFVPSEKTVDDWFNFWIENIVRRFSTEHSSQLPRTVQPKYESDPRTAQAE